jgi:RNA polymerase sigma factor (sigma-70 family)
MPASAAGDAELVARCRSGDDDAWRELVARFSRYVYAIVIQAYRLPAADAEDVFQEVFARTYERLAELREDASIRPWIGQLTRRLSIDHLRGRRDAGVEPPEQGEVDAALSRIEEALYVREGLARLSPECQEILDRFFCRDQSYGTIADELGIAGGTVGSRISRCLAKLREQLDEGRTSGRAPSGGR